MLIIVKFEIVSIIKKLDTSVAYFIINEAMIHYNISGIYYEFNLTKLNDIKTDYFVKKIRLLINQIYNLKKQSIN